MNLLPKLNGENAINIPAPKQRSPGEETLQSNLFDNGLPNHIKRGQLVVDFNYSQIDALKVKMIESKNMVTILNSIIEYAEQQTHLEFDDEIKRLVEVVNQEIEIVTFANQCRASIVAL